MTRPLAVAFIGLAISDTACARRCSFGRTTSRISIRYWAVAPRRSGRCWLAGARTWRPWRAYLNEKPIVIGAPTVASSYHRVLQAHLDGSALPIERIDFADYLVPYVNTLQRGLENDILGAVPAITNSGAFRLAQRHRVRSGLPRSALSGDCASWSAARRSNPGGSGHCARVASWCGRGRASIRCCAGGQRPIQGRSPYGSKGPEGR